MDSYEELVKDIYEQLGKASGVKILGYGKDCKYKGKSEVEHYYMKCIFDEVEMLLNKDGKIVKQTRQ